MRHIQLQLGGQMRKIKTDGVIARSQLSLSEAAVLYRRAKTVALSSRVALCSSGDDRPIELKDIQTRADWTQAR